MNFKTKLLVLVALISALAYSCKKDLGSLISTEKAYSPEELRIETFRKYYLELVKKEGKTAPGISGVSSKNKPNLKHAIWKKAHYTKTKTGSFVEVPLLYNQRSGLILKKDRKNDKSIDKEIFKGSFDRLILYKVDGSTEYEVRIVSFIPDIEYLRKHHNDVSHNHLSKMDKDFTGFLEYKKWDGTRLSIHQKERGRTIKIAFSSQKKDVLQKKIGSKTMNLMSEGECGFEIVAIMGESCIGAGPESETEQECTEYVVGYETVPIPCEDYCALYNIGCEEEEPPLTGDDCIDFGIGCGEFNYLEAFYAPDEYTFVSDTAISLQNLLKCFNAVTGPNPTYSMSLCADVPNNNNPNMLVTPSNGVGHAFLTMTKSDGTSTVTKSFGFYPNFGPLSLTGIPVGSKMNDNGDHSYDASITMTVGAAAFQSALARAIYLAGHESYDITDYNCTTYAIEVFNTARNTGSEIEIDPWYWGPKYYGDTPNGLYKELAALKANGDSSIQLGASTAPTKTGTCPE